MRLINALVAVIMAVNVFPAVPRMLSAQASDELRIMIIGAHPDDPEKACGTAALYAAMGHKVCLVSLTNGDAGHYDMGGGPLAARRYQEAQRSGAVIGAQYIVMDNHDGELMPTLENRRKVIKVIREFKPDLVIGPRTNDYHPDHRYTAVLIQDASYLVTVPNVVANTPIMERSPVFMYVYDNFQKPNPFEPTVVVGIDETIEKKMDMYDAHESQMYEWLPFNGRMLSSVPTGKAERREWMASQRRRSNESLADRHRDMLIKFYGQEKGSKIKYAEAFEASEYGTRLTEERIKTLFPFFGSK